MRIKALSTAIFQTGQNLLTFIDSALARHHIKLHHGDLLVVASKIAALSQNRVVDLEKIKPTAQAEKLAKRCKFSPAFAQIVLNEADFIGKGVKGAVITIAENILIANAGADQSNMPENFVVLWPKNPARIAQQIHDHILKKYKIKIGVIIVDSHCQPLRTGTSGLALAIAGFEGVIDDRGKKDLYGKKMRITRKAVADELASSAHVLMGETAEKKPLAIIKNAPIKLSNKKAGVLTNQLKMPRAQCVFSEFYGMLSETKKYD